MNDIDLSVVVPVYNEVENVAPLMAEITAALADQPLTYEVLFVDDGSHDGSFEKLSKMAQDDAHIVVIQFRRNHGQTAAFAAGFDHAQGEFILTMDADRQNDPADIPKLMKKISEGHDVVNGWRENRQDGFLLRKLPSYIANRLIARLSKVPLRDRGCSIRLFRAEVVRDLHLYGELHRFIPEMVSFAGFTMAEVPVNHRARVAGDSKYGLSRTFRVIVDLFTVLFLRNYGDRPMHLFGAIGTTTGGLGLLTFFYLSMAKLWAAITEPAGFWIGFEAYEIGSRPLLLVAVVLTIIGVQFIVMGLLAELLVRTYYETQNKTVYYVREIVRGQEIVSNVQEPVFSNPQAD